MVVGQRQTITYAVMNSGLNIAELFQRLNDGWQLLTFGSLLKFIIFGYCFWSQFSLVLKYNAIRKQQQRHRMGEISVCCFHFVVHISRRCGKIKRMRPAVCMRNNSVFSFLLFFSCCENVQRQVQLSKFLVVVVFIEFAFWFLRVHAMLTSWRVYSIMIYVNRSGTYSSSITNYPYLVWVFYSWRKKEREGDVEEEG